MCGIDKSKGLLNGQSVKNLVKNLVTTKVQVGSLPPDKLGHVKFMKLLQNFRKLDLFKTYK